MNPTITARLRQYQDVLLFALGLLLCLTACGQIHSQEKTDQQDSSLSSNKQAQSIKLDTLAYDAISKHLARADSSGRWPVKGPYPSAGAILPFNRIVAFYGNFLSKKMGILGQYPEEEMLDKLKDVKSEWEKADSTLPVKPALHYIAVVAQGAAGKDGLYRTRMPVEEIERVISMAKSIDALVFLDVQTGFSTLQKELPLLEKYLKLSQVHLGIDPEFSMKGKLRPGKEIGKFTATDINFATSFLANLAQKHQIPPKILIVHRFTNNMVQNYEQIILREQVQIVMHMDGWGSPSRKKGSYYAYIYKKPVQFAGFKIFYKNDLKESPHRLLTPEQILKLTPIPIYIQYH